MRFMIAFMAAALITVTQAFAQEEADTKASSMTLELNRATASDDGGCQIIFFGKNESEEDFAEVAWRLAVFDADGVFKNLLSLPLGALSPGKRRVVQYNLPFACGELSEIIVNDTAKCTLVDGSESDACLKRITVLSRASIAFGL